MYTFSTFRFIDVPYYLLKYKRSVFGKIQSNNWVAKELKRLEVLKAKYHTSRVIEIFYVQPVGLFRLTCQVYVRISPLLVQQIIIRISFRVQSAMVQLIRKK